MGSLLDPLVGLVHNTGLTNTDCVSGLWSVGTSTTLGVASPPAVHELSSAEATHGLAHHDALHPVLPPGEIRTKVCELLEVLCGQQLAGLTHDTSMASTRA